MQSFLKIPHFNKNFFYSQPQDKYQEFCNAYAYYKQAVLCDPKPNRQKLLQECIIAWKEVKKQDADFIENKIHEYCSTIPPTIRSHQRFFLSHHTPIISTPNPTPTLTSQHLTSRQIVGFVDTLTIRNNAKSQQNVAEKINLATKNLAECQQMVEITTDNSLKDVLKTKIIEEQKTILEQHVILNKLKRHADAQAKLTAKKLKALEEGVVEKYDSSGRPSAAMKDPELWDKIHNSVEFEAAHAKRRKVVIKVRTIK